MSQGQGMCEQCKLRAIGYAVCMLTESQCQSCLLECQNGNFSRSGCAQTRASRKKRSGDLGSAGAREQWFESWFSLAETWLTGVKGGLASQSILAAAS